MTKKELQHYYDCLPILINYIKMRKWKGDILAERCLDDWDETIVLTQEEAKGRETNDP